MKWGWWGRERLAVGMLLILLAGAAAGEDAAPAKALPRAEIDKQIVLYLQGGAEERTKVLAALADGDGLKNKAEAATWAKTILEKARKVGTRLKPKTTNLLERLSGKQLEFNKMMQITSAPVAEVETPNGKMRAIVLEAKEKLPAVCVYLHGGGNVGGDHPGSLDNEMAWGWGLLRAKPIASLPFKLMPRCLDDQATNAWIKDGEAQAVDALLDALLRTYDVQPDRICVFGVSMGGFGAWNIASLLADRFAAVVDATGGCARHGPFPNLRNLPFAVFMGAQDTGRAATAKKGIEELQALKAADAEGYEAVYNEYPGMGHELQDKALADINLYLKDKVRRAYPRMVVWHPAVAWKRRFYNLAIAAPAVGMTVRAEMGKDNVVTVKSERVPALTLYLNDALADLDKEVQVVWNGEKVFAGRLPRRLGVILETLADRCDAGMYFTARIELQAK